MIPGLESAEDKAQIKNRKKYYSLGKQELQE